MQACELESILCKYPACKLYTRGPNDKLVYHMAIAELNAERICDSRKRLRCSRDAVVTMRARVLELNKSSRFSAIQLFISPTIQGKVEFSTFRRADRHVSRTAAEPVLGDVRRLWRLSAAPRHYPVTLPSDGSTFAQDPRS